MPLSLPARPRWWRMSPHTSWVLRPTRSRLRVRRRPQAKLRAPDGSSAVGQREQLPEAIRELVLDDQRLRNEIGWSVFEC